VKINSSLKIRSTSSLFIFSSARLSVFAVAVLSLVSLSIGHAQTAWVDQTFTEYTPGATLNTTLSPTLITNLGVPTLYTTITNDSGNNMARYQKTTTTTNGSQVMFAFSPTNEMTARVSGYVSFKIKQNVNSAILTASSFEVGIGDTNLATTTASAANRFISVSFFQSTGSNNIQIKSGTNKISTNTYTASSTYPKVQIWFNDSDTTSMPYTMPSGVSTNLSTNSFVVYLGTTLLTPSASGTALAGAGGASLNIGKIGFSTASTGAIDFNFDDVYAAGSAPVVASIAITSAPTASAMVGYPFTFQVVADATTFGSSSLPSGGLSITTGGLITGTPTTAGPLNVALSVSNAAEVTGSGNLAITVAAAPTSAPVMGGATTASGNVSTTFNYQILASNTPRSYTTTLLPAGLTLNPATGLISGIPTKVGDTTVTLTAENPAGTSSSQDLTISIGIAPPNIFTGGNASLNNALSWSLNSTPTSSGNPGSYTDLVFSSTTNNLTTSSGNVFGKSWNVTNGNSYTFSSASSAQTLFKIGNNSPAVTPFYNSVAASNDVLVYLINGSSLTFSPSNTVVGVAESFVSLYNSGSLQIGSGSVLNIKASVIEGSGSRSITKKGVGTLILGTNNTYRGGTIVEAGIVNADGVNALGAGAVTVSGGTLNIAQANAYAGITTLSSGNLVVNSSQGLGTGAMTLAGGALANTVDLDLSHIVMNQTTSGSITFDKPSGSTTTINGATTLNVATQTTLSTYTLAGNSDTNNLVTKKGLGTLWLRGGGAPTVMGGWRVEAGTLVVGTTSSSGIGTGTLMMAGGNLKFSKGVGSTGTYTGHGVDAALQVLADTTITLDPNSATPVSNNTVSFTNLIAGQQTIHVAKGESTKSSATDVGYTDPLITFAQASLSGLATTFDVATNVQTTLQAATGSGGVTKTGSGKLTLANNNGLYVAKATATLASDVVTSIVITYSGDSSHPYTTAPVVTIAAPASGTTATATAILTDGLVTSVAVVDGGTGYTSAPSVTIASPAPTPNSYSGPTAVDEGTLALSGSHSSGLAFATASVLETALVSSNSPTTTRAIAFASGAKVRPVGTPTLSSYTLVTAAEGITGTPELETSISGYALTKSSDGKSLILQSASATDAYATYLSDNGLQAGTAFDAMINGVKVGLKYAFASANGMPQNNGVTAVPVIAQLQNGDQEMTYTFDVKGDFFDVNYPSRTVTYQTSSDLVNWAPTPAQAVSDGTGSSPYGFLKKQVKVTGSDSLFIRIIVTL